MIGTTFIPGTFAPSVVPSRSTLISVSSSFSEWKIVARMVDVIRRQRCSLCPCLSHNPLLLLQPSILPLRCNGLRASVHHRARGHYRSSLRCEHDFQSQACADGQGRTLT